MSNIDWFIISELLGETSISLRNKDSKLNENIVHLMIKMFQIAESNNINMEEAWQQWNKKALLKNYY